MRILLIDDDKDDQGLFCEAVKQVSDEIICDTADNGIEGLELLDSYERLPAVVFLDINMPLMDGRETLKIIRSTPKLKDLPVVMYSTSNDVDEVARFRGMKAKYAVKPTSFQSLVQLLTKELAALQLIKENLLVLK